MSEHEHESLMPTHADDYRNHLFIWYVSLMHRQRMFVFFKSALYLQEYMYNMYVCGIGKTMKSIVHL